VFARKTLSLLGLTCLLLLACACAALPAESGSGNIISETRQVSGFDAVVFSGAGHVEIVQDGSESITIATDDNVMPYVTTEVRGGTLYVGLDFVEHGVINMTEMNITLHVDMLESIETSGA
jgi:L-asparaginase/Glu-tRNA(Gln) amidotransferase subunit D